jgi:hypothetical protein
MQPVRAHETIVIRAECAMGCWTTQPPGYVKIRYRLFRTAKVVIHAAIR